MQNEITNEIIIKKDGYEDMPDREEAIKALINDIASAKNDMEIARQNFDCVFKPEDVDIYIYKLRAAQARYGKLINKLKALS